MELLTIGLNAAGMVMSGKGMVESGNKLCKTVKESGVTHKIAGKVKQTATAIKNDNRGIVDFDAPVLGRKSGNNSNGIYEKADYHGKKNNAVKNKAPNKGQEALDNSVEIGPNTTRRVGISDGEIVVFDETTSGIFHGHVRSWNELSEQMKAALRKAGMVNKKGKIIN